jgi:alpha-galactosidase
MIQSFKICCPPDSVTIHTEDSALRASCSGDFWTVNGITLQIKAQQGILPVVLESAGVPVRHVRLRWDRQMPAARILGDHWERGYGDLEWRGIVPERVLPWYFLMWDGSQAEGFGVMTGPNAMCRWQVDDRGISLWLDTRCGAVGVMPGSTFELCRILGLDPVEGETPFAAAQRLCAMLCPNPLMPKAPVYGGNNWYYAYGRSSHGEILDDSKRIAELAPSGGNRPYMVIDDGWQELHGNGYNGGPWGRGNSRFPDMAALADGMKRAGTIPGIWVRPLLTRQSVPNAWLLPAQRFLNAPEGPMLDPSVPEALELVKGIFRTVEGWGYGLIKHDFTTYDILGRWGFAMGSELTNSGWSFHNKTKTTAQVVKGLYAAIRESVGPDTLLLGCNTVSHLSAGYFEVQRTGDDTSGREWERTRRMGINTLAFRMPQHGAFYACDADCAGVTRQVPWELNRQWLDLLARSGTPLFVSAEPEALGQEQRKAVRAALEQASRQRPMAMPLDWTETTCPSRWLMLEGVAEYDWHTL